MTSGTFFQISPFPKQRWRPTSGSGLSLVAAWTMAAQEAAAGSLSPESCVLELPSTYDIGHFVLQRPSQEPSSEALGPPVEFQSLPCSSDVDSDTCNLNTEPKDSWASENYRTYASVEGQSETEEEDGGLRKALDVFYEAFGRPQPASRNPLSVRMCQCLTQKITELRGQESQAYTLRTFQMARVILSRDGCSVLQRHSKDTCFYPLEETAASLDDEKPIPGLSADVIRFLLQQKVMKEP
ncbi:shieldin complex subunit 1 [Ochotona princeps]|uniref:shieldin complex subunit 1 n=1 Tax=Ochotona princeps TaxID=9978 RepID=UPI0027144FC1|nr:shieldin complex subunit 1 [Ochotona princeps]